MKIRTTETCKECGRKYYAKGLCKLHYARKQHGRKRDLPVLKHTNEYVVHGDVAIFTYYDKNRNPVGEFQIDKYSIEKVKPYKWSVINTGYIATYQNGKLILLHRFLTDCPSEYVVDHINHDKKDNRMCNLRVCTQKENNNNLRTRSNTGLHGISKTKAGYYMVQIRGKYQGCSKELKKAIEIRNKAIKGTEVERLNYL